MQPAINGGCGRVQINAAGAEDEIGERVREVLNGVRLVAAPDGSERAALDAERAVLEQRLRDAQLARFVAGELSPAGFAEVRA
jgi:hypothetical protein